MMMILGLGLMRIKFYALKGPFCSLEIVGQDHCFDAKGNYSCSNICLIRKTKNVFHFPFPVSAANLYF